MNTFWTGYFTMTSVALTLVQLLVVGAGLFALFHAARTPADAFTAASKWQKNYWIITLVVCTLFAMAYLNGTGVIIGAIGSLVYLLDARPKLDEVRRPRY
ncbi:hypothetical protein TPAU25S_02745 [Tsukamurella paurometabola]|uniref:DUF2516 domain-containing protein n=1 Tax=Tsukamurella paurometabola (strain ATCC 8368 / DSM 20162 / CCUG 35730 / CIP 100753 / JCM 10117 / KCTC 9821 / NBRC 16120 / NCIMB 702349 / NCTC 13040) TaxID=521096 RepID=D5UXZ8_TSUPD|nr:DUF2516 family protein [Tsukamurella paurometabola]ADG80235.1 conserved hypothetical protein [Tsukamurella paurometabola DSM 20162]SUP38948.1 Protein of uncharacterised function (DUF2516) [Tsukamurella paurometabola]